MTGRWGNELTEAQHKALAYGRTLKRKHGHTIGGHSRTYRSWLCMINRCTNPEATQYKWYGGRGIKVCRRWLDFSNFLADMGERPEGKSLERIKNSKGYRPGNCKWATQLEQCNNQRTNVLLTYEGKTLSIAQWARELGIHKARLYWRTRRGWSVKDTLSVPRQNTGRMPC